ncbi:hypothetical protein BC628DRAFT_848472 [Trametes gibbosa]|nr:hypothetical protein BC628DRAFT_848472 [Trametes gibbosa]
MRRENTVADDDTAVHQRSITSSQSPWASGVLRDVFPYRDHPRNVRRVQTQFVHHLTQSLSLSTCSRSSIILSESLLIFFTWKSTVLDFRTLCSSEGRTKTLRGVLFENGTFFFIILFILNTLSVILTQTNFTLLATVLSFLRDMATPLLISRFLLNLLELREPNESSVDEVYVFSSGMTNGLDSLAGYAGSDLVHGDEEAPSLASRASQEHSQGMQMSV